MSVVLFLFFLVAGANSWAYDFEYGGSHWAQWTACTAAEECVPIYDECYGWTAVNQQYKKEGEEYQAAMGAASKCVQDEQIQPPPKILCLDHTCTPKFAPQKSLVVPKVDDGYDSEQN